MKLRTPAVVFVLASRFFLPTAGHAQASAPAPPAPAPAKTLSIVGYTGTAPVVQLNGRSYVAVDTFVRLIGGTVLTQSNRLTLTLPVPRLASPTNPPAVAAEPPPPVQPPPQKTGFTPDFLRAGIEALTDIREWRVAIVNAVQTGNPVSEDWVGPYRRAADTKRALAATAASSDSDHQAVPLLQNEFTNMQQLSDSFLALNKSRTYTPTDSFDNNPLDQKVLACARGLADLGTSGGQFQDVPSCH